MEAQRQDWSKRRNLRPTGRRGPSIGRASMELVPGVLLKGQAELREGQRSAGQPGDGDVSSHTTGL